MLGLDIRKDGHGEVDSDTGLVRFQKTAGRVKGPTRCVDRRRPCVGLEMGKAVLLTCCRRHGYMKKEKRLIVATK